MNRITEACRPSCITMAQLIIATKSDPQLNSVSNSLLEFKSPNKPNSCGINKYFRNAYDELSLTQEGVILRNDSIVIPESLQQEVINYAHEGHNGRQLCKRLLRNICWFPKMDTMVDRTIGDCITCQCNEDNTTTEPIVPSTIPESAWHTLSIRPKPDQRIHICGL